MASNDRHQEGEMFDAQTRMAAHRTFLAYIRTGLQVIVLGFVIDRFNIHLWNTEHSKGLPYTVPWMPMWLGIAITVFGVTINIIATVHHYRVMRRAAGGEAYRPEKWSPDLIVGAGMVLLGIAIVISLFLSR